MTLLLTVNLEVFDLANEGENSIVYVAGSQPRSLLKRLPQAERPVVEN